MTGLNKHSLMTAEFIVLTDTAAEIRVLAFLIITGYTS